MLRSPDDQRSAEARRSVRLAVAGAAGVSDGGARLRPGGRVRPVQGRPHMTARQRRDALLGYLLISPALLLFLCFILGPVIGAIVLSLFNYDLLSPPVYVGLGNYRRLADDPVAWQSLLVTTEFTIASVVLHVSLGSSSRWPSTGACRPLCVTVCAPPYSFRCSFRGRSYPLSPSTPWTQTSALSHTTWARSGSTTSNAFENPHTALAAIVGVDLWHTVGFSFIVLLAGLQMIPRHLYEAARVDGAGANTHDLGASRSRCSPRHCSSSL